MDMRPAIEELENWFKLSVSELIRDYDYSQEIADLLAEKHDKDTDYADESLQGIVGTVTNNTRVTGPKQAVDVYALPGLYTWRARRGAHTNMLVMECKLPSPREVSRGGSKMRAIRVTEIIMETLQYLVREQKRIGGLLIYREIEPEIDVQEADKSPHGLTLMISFHVCEEYPRLGG